MVPTEASKFSTSPLAVTAAIAGAAMKPETAEVIIEKFVFMVFYGRINHRLKRVNLLSIPKKKHGCNRIIGGRRIKQAEKILSVYEPDIKVILRGKSGTEVEFGNQLVIGENRFVNGEAYTWIVIFS